jgi:hypothetical protein
MLRERVSVFFFPAAIVIALLTDKVLSSAGCCGCGARSQCSTAKLCARCMKMAPSSLHATHAASKAHEYSRLLLRRSCPTRQRWERPPRVTLHPCFTPLLGKR